MHDRAPQREGIRIRDARIGGKAEGEARDLHGRNGGGELSPRALGKYTEGSRMTVCLSAPVRTAGSEEANLLEIAGENGAYVPARAEVRGDRLLLSAAGLDHPVRVRYAWTDWSDRVNLYGLNGLPLEPFAF